MTTPKVSAEVVEARDELAKSVHVFAYDHYGDDEVHFGRCVLVEDLREILGSIGYKSPAQVEAALLKVTVRHDRAIAAKDREISQLYKLLTSTEKNALDESNSVTAQVEALLEAAWHVGVRDGRQSAMLRMEPKSPYTGAFYNFGLADRLARTYTKEAGE